MVLTVAQCLDMALENDRLAAVASKQSIKTQHTNVAEFYRNLAGEHAKPEVHRSALRRTISKYSGGRSGVGETAPGRPNRSSDLGSLWKDIADRLRQVLATSPYPDQLLAAASCIVAWIMVVVLRAVIG